MEVIIVEEKKNRLLFDIKGDDHTITNALRKELLSDEHVKSAAYGLDHPLIGHPRVVVETDGEDPKKTVHAAIKRLQKQLEKVKVEAKNLK